MPESYPLQYPLRKLYDEIYSFPTGSTTDNIIDLEGGVYYYNGTTATGIDGIEYGPMDDTHANRVDSYGAVRYNLESNLQLKNGTIILYRTIQGDDLVDEGNGIYSFSHNMEYEPEPQIHDPGEDNVSKKPRLATYPPQREDNLTNFSFDENSWNNPPVLDVNEEKVVQPITELFEDGKYYLTGIYVGNTGSPNIYEDMINILDEIVENESAYSTRQEAALGMAVSYRGLQNQIYTTTISGYSESATGITYTYSYIGPGTLTESDLYHSAFNWFGRRTFFNYGATAESGISVYTPVLNENKILYAPARGSCTQIFASIDGIDAPISGLDEGVSPYWAHGFMYQVFASNQALELDENSYVTGFKHKVRYENIEFIGSMKDTSGRGFLVGSDQSNGGSELEIIGCTFHKGPGHFSASYHGLTIDNTLFLYPRFSIGGISSLGGATITKSKFIGPEKSSCISTSNQDYAFKFVPKEILIKGNYFNVKESNHGQAISSYANSYHKYRIIGNIFHNCQRALSLQSSAFTEWNWQLMGLSGDDGNPESMGDGYILANNLIYIDEIPVQGLGGQSGVAFNGAQPTTAKIFTVIDDGILDDLIANQVTSMVIQTKNPDGSFSDRNYTPELIAGPEPSLDPSAVNTHRFSFENFSNNYFDQNIKTETRNIPTVNGKKELYAFSSDFNRSNFWLGLLENPPEPLYLRLYNYATNVTYAEGITVDSVRFLKNPPKVTVKRNTAILSRSLAADYDAKGKALQLNAVNGINTTWAGSADVIILDAEGTERQIGAIRAGSNGPFEFTGNVVWGHSSIGFSGGVDVDNLIYTDSNRRLIGEVIFENNVRFSSSFTSAEEEVYGDESEFITESRSVSNALDIIYPNLANTESSDSLVPSGSGYDNIGIIWTDDGTTSGDRTYPNLSNLKLIPTNWSETSIPVDFFSDITPPSLPARYHLVFEEPIGTVFMSVWDGTDWSVYKSDSSTGLTKEFTKEFGPGGLSGENQQFIIQTQDPGDPSGWRDFDYTIPVSSDLSGLSVNISSLDEAPNPLFINNFAYANVSGYTLASDDEITLSYQWFREIPSLVGINLEIL
jgi:hypothetical protein